MAEWQGHERGSREYRRILAGLFFAGVATFAQLYSTQALLPEIAAELRIAPATAALTLSVAAIGLAVGVIPWSVLADRIGRVRAMTIALAGASLIALVVPFSPSIPVLLAGRFVEGLLVAGVPATAIALLGEEIAKRDIVRAAGIYVAGTSIGGLSGRLVAGPVGELVSWRIGVLAVGFVCGLATVAFIFLVPRARGFVSSRAAGRGLGHRLAVNLKSPRLLVLYAQGFLLMGAFVALYNYLGFRLLGEPFGLPQLFVSLIFVAYLSGTVSASWAGGVASRFGPQRVLVGAGLVMIAGVALTAVDQLAVVLVGLVVATAGFFAAHAIASGWTGREAVVGRAQASSLYNLAYYAGSSLFGWFGGVVLAWAGWDAVVGLIVALVLLASILAAVVLRPRRA
ncbi:MFS transporter [Herbiconiux sp. CPCC 203407]|uniref:MFS transporter n=1 Tax=Herbiconiux oxytropis TaxID=2970915 RepID=A0AA41XEM1_9MICO|nr:MFS transporter [Herbiconiux oxytropis]MCS5724204.1 MFS transporter [Herbiconiux oxytropis]MCS5726792.1 MFS transporter [Herbiconiux oxytropis]